MFDDYDELIESIRIKELEDKKKNVTFNIDVTKPFEFTVEAFKKTVKIPIKQLSIVFNKDGSVKLLADGIEIDDVNGNKISFGDSVTFNNFK